MHSSGICINPYTKMKAPTPERIEDTKPKKRLGTVAPDKTITDEQAAEEGDKTKTGRNSSDDDQGTKGELFHLNSPVYFRSEM